MPPKHNYCKLPETDKQMHLHKKWSNGLSVPNAIIGAVGGSEELPENGFVHRIHTRSQSQE